ncbi:MAG: polysaccharide deacetylase [Mycobacterium sp.]|nr:polysaccharide deacetylase [Mycobacterium sp.]
MTVWIRAVAALLMVVLLWFSTQADADAADVDCAVVKCVALTFDDGPGPHTDRLLQVLAADDAKATFFVVGEKVAANPAAARRIADAGMELGNHTWSHPDLTTLSAPEVATQLRSTTDVIAQATGQRPRLMRPGFGMINEAVLAEVGRQGMAAVNWDVVPYDWINDTDLAASRAVLMEQIEPGSVVLLHDTFASTVDLVQQFLPVLRANGYHPVTVSEMLGPRAPGSVHGSRDNGPAVNDLRDLPLP